MIGCVGEDSFGETILSNLQANGVITEYVEPVTDIESGTAHIILAEGDNSIVVVKAANDRITPDYVDQAAEVIQAADIVLIQQEIPEETVVHVSELCARYQVPLMLNPAPARPVPSVVIERAAYMTPNEHEAAILFGDEPLGDVLRRYPNKLIVTEGKRGVRYFDGNEEVVVPGYKVEAVDTTGAGDTFNGAFAVALSEGMSMADSLRFANRAASLSVMKFGAQGGMPSRLEVEGSL